MKTTDTATRAPRHLSESSRAFWRQISADYELESHHLRLLTLACEALDRVDEARAVIAAEGAFLEGRFGKKLHPAILLEDRSRLAAARLLRELGLDLEAPAVTRPPSRFHRR